ncbi:MAG: hypothetical protein QGH66_02300 [Dehalococcoidia bacterium]|nr:hypothetical protein [Dehalococcoidia bacterium]MDP7470455.1 hypothetical protein [Dehalococcoidia bacterium]
MPGVLQQVVLWVVEGVVLRRCPQGKPGTVVVWVQVPGGVVEPQRLLPGVPVQAGPAAGATQGAVP